MRLASVTEVDVAGRDEIGIRGRRVESRAVGLVAVRQRYELDHSHGDAATGLAEPATCTPELDGGEDPIEAERATTRGEDEK
jgi:hypothetical protein